MSRTLKRPMFRKGGEVMEGIMTGIKPRESFQDKGMSDTMRDDIKSIQNRINLVDTIAGVGASPLGDPLTQFLLQTGQNLIGGTAAGGTKLQEIVGATKDPLNKAIAAQTRKDLSRRKLAATFLSKMGGDDITKIKRNAARIAKETGRDQDTVFKNLLNKFIFKDEQSPGEVRRKQISNEAKSIMERNKDYRNVPKFGFNTSMEMAEAKLDLINSEQFKKNRDKFTLDSSNYYLPADVKLTDGKKPGTKIPSDTEDLEVNNIYYNYKDGIWYLYDGVTLSPRFNRPKKR